MTVFERTEARTDWLQGYRIHINPHGSRALHDCLPQAAWQRFLDTVSVNDGGFGFTTEQLHDLQRFAGPEILPDAGPADAHYGASRISLREVLCPGWTAWCVSARTSSATKSPPTDALSRTSRTAPRPPQTC